MESVAVLELADMNFFSVVDGTSVKITDSDGTFRGLEEKTFIIPENTGGDDLGSPSPTPAPTASTTISPVSRAPTTQAPTFSPVICEDSVSEEFLVDRVAGNRGCNWLASNMENYGYLCNFLYVAATCKSTCDACRYFE